MVKKSSIENMLKLRSDNGFKTLEVALSNPTIKKLGFKAKELTLTSEYFLIRSYATNQENDITLYTIIKRSIESGGVKLSVIQQTINTL